MLIIGMNGVRLLTKIDAAQIGMALTIRLTYDSMLAGATGEMAL